jgi:hypothetical protein
MTGDQCYHQLMCPAVHLPPALACRIVRSEAFQEPHNLIKYRYFPKA